jgi:protein O-mannosyl-transferase
LLVLAAVIVFGGCLWGSFHFDDYSMFSRDLWRPLETRPLTYLTFWTNEKLGGQNPAGYLAVNLLLHLIAIVLLWDTLSRWLPPAAVLIATAIFAVHPFQAEPVNYVFARSSALATVLCLAALASWNRERRWWAVAWFALALLAKEECVAFPVFLLLLHFSVSRDRKELKPIAAMFALSLAAGVRVLIAANTTAGSGGGAQAAISWQTYLAAQGIVILRYLRMLVLPWGFSIDPGITIPPAWLALVAWFGIATVTVLASFRFRQAQAGFWFIAGLVLLLPSSSIFPATDLAADRRMYLPMIAFAASAGLLLAKVRPIFLAPFFLLLCALSFMRTNTWKTEESLWADAVEKAPSKLRPTIQLARAVDPQRGIEILERAKRDAPDEPRIPSEEGRIYLAMGKTSDALMEFGRALALAPRNPDALNNRGAALLALDQKDAARQDFERALSIDPCEFNARLNLLHLGVLKPLPPDCKFSPEQMKALSGR